MKRFNAMLLCGAVGCLLLTNLSCKTPEVTIQAQQDIIMTQSIEPQLIGGRMSFVSQQNFQEYIEKLTANIDLTLSSVSEDLKKQIQAQNFISLSFTANPEYWEGEAIKLANKQDANPLANINGNEVIENLYMASLFNKDGEVVVANKIYRVTKEGTFSCKIEDSQSLNKLLSKNNVLNSHWQRTNDENYQVNDKIFFHDSFEKLSNPKARILGEDDDSGYDLSGSTSSFFWPDNTCALPEENLYKGSLSKSTYTSLKTFSFGSGHTIVGKWIAGAIGEFKPYFDYYPSRYRAKVKMYNVNLGIVASAGINVKLQEKKWWGGWWQTDTDELRVGWDGLVLEFPITTTALPSPNMTPTFEKIDFTFGGVKPIKALSAIMVGPKNNPQYRDIIKKIDAALIDAASSKLSDIMKDTWNLMVCEFAPTQFQAFNDATRIYTRVFPDKLYVVLTRYEESTTNASVISRTLIPTTTAQVGVSSNGSASSPFFKAAKGGKIVKASIYGMTQNYSYGGWRGLRIVKE